MEKQKNFSKNIVLLGIVSFLNDLSSEMIMPILPMFIETLGGGGFVIGLVGGLRDSIASILKVFAGYWSDKIGKRKIFVFSGYLTSAFFKFVLAFSKIWQHILAFASLERIGKGLRTAPRDAIIAQSLPEQKGKGFGIHRAMDSAGAIGGSILVFFLFWYFGFSFKNIILVAGVLALVSLLPLLFVKEKKTQQKQTDFRITIKTLPANLKFFILIASIFALANFSYMFFVLRVKDFFDLGGGSFFGIKNPTALTIILYILFNIFYTVFAIPFGKLSDKFGKKIIIAFGYFIFGVVCLGFVWVGSLEVFAFLFALYGITYAMIDGSQRAFISDMAPEKIRATALGAFHTSIGLASLPASLIAGGLWKINPQLSFIYGALFSFLSFSLFVLLGLKKKV